MDWFFNLPDILSNILRSFEFRLIMLIIKISAAFFSLIFLIGIVYFLRNSTYLKVRYFQILADFFRSGAAVPTKQVVRRWNEILRNLESSEEQNWKLAILDADNILGTILKGMGYKGETVDERLAQVQPIHISNIEEIMKMHEVRHQIARNPNFKLTQERTREIIEAYRKTFENLELI